MHLYYVFIFAFYLTYISLNVLALDKAVIFYWLIQTIPCVISVYTNITIPCKFTFQQEISIGIF